MSRETVTEKAVRYLLDGRLLVERVDDEAIVAICAGDSGVYELSRDAGGDWQCSCPALRRCSHLAALELVTGGRWS